MVSASTCKACTALRASNSLPARAACLNGLASSVSVPQMSAWDTHLDRLANDSAYKEGFDYGGVGGTADANPWSLGDPRRSAWNDGWRNGGFQHRLAKVSPDIEAALRTAIETGATPG